MENLSTSHVCFGVAKGCPTCSNGGPSGDQSRWQDKASLCGGKPIEHPERSFGVRSKHRSTGPVRCHRALRDHQAVAQLSQGRPPIRGFWGERDEPKSNGLQLQPNTDGLQPKSDGFQPECRKNELAILTGCCLGGLATVGVGSLGGFKPFSRTCLPWRRDSTSSS